ncbi:MAG: allantoicase [Bacteroidia bacterium]
MAHSSVKEIIKTAPEFTQLTDLASERLGGKVIFATDDFFAEKENLLKPTRGVFITDKFTERGKWMDGWESRRKRTSGHDWAIIELATSGKITGFDIDTNFFLGNHPPNASIEAVYIDDSNGITDWDNENINWKEVLPKSHLDAGSQNFYESNNQQELFTHIRLHIYPDGGVARLRVYGEVYKNWELVKENETIDLASAINGAQALECNDMFFSAMSNLLMPGRGVNMGDGWETKRNRTPNNRDWVIIKLAHAGIIDQIIVDTCHFKGNYPDSCTIDGINSNGDVSDSDSNWSPILPKEKLSADHIHEFTTGIVKHDAITHVRLCMYPDGGISRLRLFGKIKK